MRKIIIVFICIFGWSKYSKAQEKLPINTSQSTIKWIGELTFHFGGHDGFINFKEGYFIKQNNTITGGEFIIDMNSITNDDIKEQIGKDNLVDHLKNADFFEVNKYPLSKLAITNVAYSEPNEAHIKANLTIKGITKPIHFRAEFNYEKKQMTTRFKIDRKDWNINYQSKFKNSFISDAIGFEVSVKL